MQQSLSASFVKFEFTVISDKCNCFAINKNITAFIVIVSNFKMFRIQLDHAYFTEWHRRKILL